MGGFFGATSRRNCILDVFFGTDYHSHLGTRRGGMAAYDPQEGLQREIHNIQNSPFRTKFEHILETMTGCAAIGCISDTDPQPILIRSKLGAFAISTIGIINNAQQLEDEYLSGCGHFEGMSHGRVNSSELLAALIATRDSFGEGIRYAQQQIEGTASILILKDGGHLIAARDYMGRLPVVLCKNEDGYCGTFEDYAAMKLGYEVIRELGPGEVVEISPEGVEVLMPPQTQKKICAFLWTYYGYPTACYEGMNVEVMRCRNGRIMAREDRKNGRRMDIDFIGGVPDSGTPHAIGYANESGIPFARPFIKYTPTWPRSFMPATQGERNMVAKMKQIPVHDLIRGKKLLFVDDSIVRGTQLRETVEFLYDHGAEEVHIRSACPPILYPCKYLNFSRSTSDNDLIARSTIVELEGEEGFNHLDEYLDGSTQRGQNLRRVICEKLHFSTLEYQTVEGILEAIGLPADQVCTYCWNGRG